MTNIIIYIILVVVIVASIIIKRDTKELIKRSDNIQKDLNKYIEREQKK